MNRHVGTIRWLIRKVFRGAVIAVPGEAGAPLWLRPSEYPSLLLGPRRVEADIAREWAALLRPEEVIYDVGANIGFTVQRFLSLLQGRCSIWAFEPLPRNIELLERNIARFRDRVTVVGSALGQTAGTTVLADNRRHGGLSRLQSLSRVATEDADFWREVEEVSIPIETLDGFMRNTQAKPPTFIKIDVEGAGHWVLSGGQDTLARHRPVLSCSFHSDEERTGIVDAATSHGYHGVRFLGGGEAQWCDPAQSSGTFVHPADVRALSFMGVLPPGNT